MEEWNELELLSQGIYAISMFISLFKSKEQYQLGLEWVSDGMLALEVEY